MAYTSKFIDRTPFINAAGVSQYKKDVNVQNCLIFPIADTLPTELKTQAEHTAYSLPPLKTDVYEGVNTKVRQLVNPPIKSVSQNLHQELNETVYDTYWNLSLGKTRSRGHYLPKSVDKYTTCFGKKTVFEDSVKDLVSPDKTRGQVLIEADVGHDLYVKTHKDYYPGEQLNRRYTKPPLNKSLIWGEIIKSDPEGGCTKKLLKWYDQNKLTAVNEIQARYKFYSQPQIGKVFAPNQNINRVPKHHTFGKVLKRDYFGAGDLMRECTPSQDKIELAEELVHINVLRNAIRKRAPYFSHRDFLQDLIVEDKKNSGWIHLSTLYDICSIYGIQADKSKLEALLLRLGILSKDKMVKYRDFTAVINVNSIFPPLVKLNDVPPELLSYETTYRAGTNNMKRHFKDYSCWKGNVWLLSLTILPLNYIPKIVLGGMITMIFYAAEPSFKILRNLLLLALPSAGLPSWWTSQDNLNGETSVEALISPNIFTQYGLSHRDFFKTSLAVVRIPRKTVGPVFISFKVQNSRTLNKKSLHLGVIICSLSAMVCSTYWFVSHYILTIKPRTRKYIYQLFERIGVRLPTEMFNQICDIGEEQDGTGGICVETFRNLLDRQATKNLK